MRLKGGENRRAGMEHRLARLGLTENCVIIKDACVALDVPGG